MGIKTKIGKRKYEKGRLRSGTWVVGCIDLETKQLKLEVCQNNKRDTRNEKNHPQTCCNWRHNYITDLWRAYNFIEAEDFAI